MTGRIDRGEPTMLPGKRSWLVGLPLTVPLIVLAAVALMIVNVGMVLFPPLVVGALGGVVYLAICFRYPLTGFALVASLNIFETVLLLAPASSGADAGFLSTISVVDLMLIALMGVVVLRGLLIKDETALTDARVHALYLLLCVTMFVMFLPGLVYAESAPGGLVAIFRTADGLVYGILALFFIRNREDLRHFALISMPFYALAALWGWYEILAGEYILVTLGLYVPTDVLAGTEAGYYRSIGPVGDSVFYSIVLVAGMALSIVLVQMTPSRLKRTLILVVFFLCGSTVLTTGSRGGLLAALIMLGIFFLFGTMRNKVAILVSVTLLGTAGMVIYTLTVSNLAIGRMASTGGEKDDTTMYRLGLYSQAWRMFTDSPVVGTGHGQFTKRAVNFFDERPPRQERLRVHSVYFQLLAEDGIPAFLLYLSILGICSLPLLGMVLQMQNQADRNIVVVLLGLVLAMAFFATNTNLLEQSYAWLSFGLAQVARHALNEDPGKITAGLARDAAPT